MKKVVILMVIIIASSLGVYGCWDNKDLQELHIVTGIGLDVSEEEGMVDVFLQVANAQVTGKSAEESSSSEGGKPLILKSTSRTISSAITKLNRESSRMIFLHHLQVIVVGLEVAEQSIHNFIDFFFRENQARLETSIVFTEGRAEDVLKAELAQDKLSSMYLANSFEMANKTSKEFQTRLIDVAFRLVDKTQCPIIPVVKMEKINDSDTFRDAGFAIIKNNVLHHVFDVEDITGLVFSKGKVRAMDHEIITGEDVVVLHISNLDTKRKMKLGENNKLTFMLDINAKANVAEVIGFCELSPLEQLEKFDELLEQEIADQILKTFKIAQDNKSDFFDCGKLLYQRYPKEWQQIFSENWDEYFPQIELDTKVNVNVQATGQIYKTLKIIQDATGDETEQEIENKAKNDTKRSV